MRRSVYILEEQYSKIVKLFADISTYGEKYLLLNKGMDDSLASIGQELGFIPVTRNQLCVDIREGDDVIVWVYYDVLGTLLYPEKLAYHRETLLFICDCVLKAKASFSLRIIIRGADANPAQRDQYLHGGIKDSVENWKMHIQITNEIVAKAGARAHIYTVPYAVGFPWEMGIEDMLAKRINDFLQFIDERLTGYSDIEKLHIFCGSRNWQEWHYDDLVAYLRGNVQNVQGFIHSLSSFVGKLQSSEFPIAGVDKEEELSKVDLLFEDLLVYYFPFISEKLYDKIYFKDTFCQINYSFTQSSKQPNFFHGLAKKSVYTEKGEITYYSAGQGEIVLIINAYGVKLDVWFRLIYSLSAHYKVIVSEIRGMLDCEVPLFSGNKSMGLFDQVDDLKAILRNEAVSSLHLISWCSGAKQAIILGGLTEFSVLSQTIIAGEFAPYTGSKPHHSKFRESVQEIYSLIKDDERIFDFYMKIIKKNIFTTQLPYKQFLGEKHDIDIDTFLFMVIPDKSRPLILNPFDSKEKMRNFLAMCVEYYQHSIEDELQKMKAPLLLISAENDQTANPAQSEWAAVQKKIGVQHFCIPHATHLLIMDRCEDILNQLMPHLNQNA